MGENLIEIKNLFAEYELKSDFLAKPIFVKALNGISLDIKKGEVLAIAGESGCGKSTLAKALMKLIDIKSGQIFFKGHDIFKMNAHNSKIFRQSVQMVFQNPYSSLNPKMTVYETMKEPLIVNKNLRTYSKDLRRIKDMKESEIKSVITAVLEQVGLDKTALELYPHEFSGGQRQRIAIARALILQPEIIIADEPVSALDVSIQAQIINLLQVLKEKFNLTIVFISHDLNVIQHLADKVAVMYLGEIVEFGEKEEIFKTPKHPYTKALLSAVPKINKQEETIILKGELPSPTELPLGCKFATRCPHAIPKCETCQPNIIEFSKTHSTSCFLYNNL